MHINDARGIAEITRTGRDYLTEVYVKSVACFEVRAQLHHAPPPGPATPSH